MKHDEIIVLGKISGLFGIKGWVKIYSETRPKEGICDYSAFNLQINGKWQHCEVEAIKPQSKTIIAKFKNINSPEEAQLLQGATIGLAASELPKLDQNTYYWRDLIGSQVKNHEGVDFGIVDAILETGANDVLVIKDVDNKERLVPFTVGHAIVSVNHEQKLIIVDWDADF